MLDNLHFDIYNYLIKCGVLNDRSPKIKGKHLICFLAVRDCGKSTSMWEFTKDYWVSSCFKDKAVYLRNSGVAIKKFIPTFNNANKNDYVMSEATINKIYVDENNKVIEKHDVGMVIPLSCSENYKSVISDDYHLMIWDEFNESDESIHNWNEAKDNHKLFKSFIDTLKTIERHRDNFLVLLMGNKVSVDNDILLTFDIDAEDKDEDVIIDRSMYIDNELFNIKFVIIGNKTFSHLNSHRTLANAIASFNSDTDRYLNKGGFLQKKYKNIKSWKSIKEGTIPKYYFIFDEYYFEYGYCGDDTMYLHSVEYNDLIDNIPIISLNLNGFMNNSQAKILDEDDYHDLMEQLMKLIKNDKILFTTNFSYQALKQIINNFILMGDF